MRICPVCDVNLDGLGKRRDAVYCSGACRAEASARRRGTSTGRTEAHRKRRRRQSGRVRRPRRTLDLRPNYAKAVRSVATVFAGPPLFVGEALARRLAEDALRAALPERQRAALEQREARR